MSEFPRDTGPVLTSLARWAIERRLGRDFGARPEADFLGANGASFVTLTKAGQLRGCIGTLEAHRTLGEDVASNAQAAAFNDPRVPQVTVEEIGHLHIEVSILSAPTPMMVTSEQDALAQFRPGIDGVILQAGWHRATFLPQVWDDLPEPHTFLTHLKRKAGLSPRYWGDDVALSRYTVTAFHEEEPEPTGKA
jgi:AmmeMemoRadiSam system protein A